MSNDQLSKLNDMISNMNNMKKLARELGADWATNDILENLLNDANGDLNTACKNLIAISSAH